MTQTIKWNPSLHAVQRLKERFGIVESNAKNFVNQLMQSATYVTTSKDGRDTYHHANRNVFIVVDTLSKIVITVYPPVETGKQPITIDRIATAIKRELSKMTTQLRREIRKLTEQQAELNVNIAELSLNKIRCKAPHTQALIQTRIDAIITQVDEIAQEVDAKLTQIKVAEREVSEVIGEV